jgi:regulator of sigma E protease
VHELGHFAVAKWAGVLVERFSIGFGPVFWKRRWGETEYALSALPFGGYVKMLGQDDNPANAQKERERSLLQSPSGTAQPASALAPTATSTEHGEVITEAAPAEGSLPGQSGEQAARLDPRSYQAKSVPARMAIISAGVIMNVIFGLIFFILVFNLGVPISPPVIGFVEPGSPAWLAGLKRGDRVVEMAGEEMIDFEHIRQKIFLSSVDQPLEIVVERDGKKIVKQVAPRKGELGPQIGVVESFGLTLHSTMPFAKDLAAGKTGAATFLGGDRITHVDGSPLTDYAELADYLGRHALDEVVVTVERAAKQGEKQRETAEINVPPQLMRSLGIRLQMGKITAVRSGSPAEAAGIKVDDVVQTVDGNPIDPLRLPDLMYELRGQDVVIEVRRTVQGEQAVVAKTVRPEDEPGWQTPPAGDRPNPMTVPSLGIAFQIVPAIVEEPDSDSPAARAGLRKGDLIINATLVEPVEEGKKRDAGKPIPINDDKPTLPAIFWKLQHTPNSEIAFEVLRDNTKVKTEAFSPQPDATWGAPFRGIVLTPLQESLPPKGFGDAVVLGYKETKRTFLTIYLTLRRLATRDVSAKNLVGPVGIGIAGYHQAATDYRLLIKFLALLSVNLAIVNFLPIPVLDGGHMFFLAWEGVRGKPPSERVHIAATWAGLVLILLLAILVTGQDIWRFVLSPIFEG